MTSDFNTSEHFELLSAYIDGELTPSEISEIQSLLQDNPDLRQQYQQLLHLKQAFKNLSQPSEPLKAEQLSARVVSQVRQERQTRSKWLWGGTAIAAFSLTTLFSVFNFNRSPFPQLADSTNPPLMLAINQISREKLTDQLNTHNEENLLIKLNEPVIAMP